MSPLAPADLTALYDQARRADIVAVAGGALFKAGRRMRGPCPLCGASKGKRADGAFSVDPRAGVFKCFGCDAGGDVITLEHLLRSRPDETLRHAAERLAGVVPAGAVRTALAPRPPAEPPPKPSQIPGQLWAGGLAAKGTLVQRYLVARGIGGKVLGEALKRLRFHPRAYWEWDGQAGRWITAPAMMALVIAPSGPTGGIHVTYLAADGTGKAALTPAKKMWGPQADLEGRPGCAWLMATTVKGDPAPLIVAEGIESALSAAVLYGAPCRCVAALSLGALQGGWLPDAYGRYDIELPRMDPARPAFTWPTPVVDPWPEVMVAVDRDMKPIVRKVRGLGGKTVERALSAEERARVCASLAAQQWLAAGAPKVRTIAPAAGADFNDQLRGES
jgi:hypothetical protein